MPIRDLTGETFGYITVLKFLEIRKRHAWFLCHCALCNQEVESIGSHLVSGQKKSCGCRRIGEKHGLTKSMRSEYQSWTSMRKRCLNPKVKEYPNYGGRGIKICDRWVNSFSKFLEDMGPRPTLKHTLERLNNNGDYTSENCKWITRQEQNNNRRTTKKITVGCVTLSMADWNREMGFKRGLIAGRINRGWNPIQAILTPQHIKKWQLV